MKKIQDNEKTGALLKTFVSLVLIFVFVGFSPTKVEAASCSLTKSSNQDVIVSFSSQKLLATDGPGYNYHTTTTGLNIPTGRYKISVETWDNHAAQNGANANQTKESVFLRLYNYSYEIFATGDTRDIPGNRDAIVTVVTDDVEILDPVTKIVAEHSYYHQSNTPESVTPVCAKFERLDYEEPEPENPQVQCQVSDTSIKTGEKVYFNAEVVDGKSPYKYDWNGAINSSSKSLSYQFNNPGTYNVSVTVEDANGKTDTDTCSTVTVTEEEPENPQVQCQVSDTSIKTGEKVYFNAEVVDGKSPYKYDWNGAINSSSKSLSYQFNNPGTYNVSVTVEDANGKTDTDTCSTVTVTEEEPEPDELQVQCQVSDTRVEEGDRVYFKAIVSGGEYPYEYDWSGDVSGYQKEISKIFTREGKYYASIRVTDDKGRTDTSTCSTVYVEEEDDDELEIECRVSDTSIDAGDKITISVDIDGGNGPFDIQWSGDDDEIDDFDDNDKSQRVTIDEEGRYSLKVTVRDDDGNKDSDTCPIIRVSDDDDDDNDVRVIASTINTPTTPTGISSIYLNQVPYTGPEDVAKTIGLVSLILIWSGIVAYTFLSKKNKKLISQKIADFKKANLARKLG